MSAATPITVAYGNGIGPEIMQAVLRILKEAGAGLAPQTVEVGESIYKKGIPTGIEQKSWDIITKNKVFLKAPLTTPQGGGFKSVNVTIRKKLGLYANIRPCISYHPFVSTKHPKMNVVIIRENEEGLYTGIEYRQTQEVVQCLKVFSRSGCFKIARFAFEYALTHNRKKVTCFTKDNIMKRTDGLFRQIFEEVGTHYQLQKEHWIVDIGAAKLATEPENFDVVVLPNLYGDILSDVAAQMSGSVGMAGSANIGDNYAMFEAIHGSAPRRAGQNVANPSGLLHGAILMLLHLGKTKEAELIHNSWLKTLEQGIHTYDIYKEGSRQSRKKASTQEFSQAVIGYLGQKPESLSPVSYKPQGAKPSTLSHKSYNLSSTTAPLQQKSLVGVDVFLDQKKVCIKNLVQELQSLSPSFLKLTAIYSRGLKVWPLSPGPSAVSDQWRLRFTSQNKNTPLTHTNIIDLLVALKNKNKDFTKTENLYLFDGEEGFSH